MPLCLHNHICMRDVPCHRVTGSSLSLPSSLQGLSGYSGSTNLRLSGLDGQTAASSRNGWIPSRSLPRARVCSWRIYTKKMLFCTRYSVLYITVQEARIAHCLCGLQKSGVRATLSVAICLLLHPELSMRTLTD